MRRLSISLAIYGLFLTILIHHLSARPFLFLISPFLLFGAIVAFKGYRDSLSSLRMSLSSQLERSEEEKKKLSEEIKKSDDYISDLRNRETMIVSLYEITKKMSENLTFNEIFNVFSAFLRENFIFKKIELLILKEEDGNTKIDKAYKVYKDESAEEDETKSDYFEVLNLFSKDKKEIFISKENGTTFAAFPLLSENKFVGILTIENLSRIDFDRFLIVATQFALEIKKVLLYETVEALAITDGLTGLYTRRYFFERLNEELNRSKRYNFKFAFLMIDIDDFKKCNDSHGHLVGDVILRDVARIIKENTREIDLVARYGGEEFALILPETDRKGACLAAERIRKKIDENVFKAYDEKLKITISAGLAIYPEDSQEAEDIIDKADRALYAAKSSGKNIVCECKD